MIWLNGEFRREGAAIDVADRGFLLGDGVFETLYVENGRAAFLDAHLTRLRRGLSVLRIAPPPALSQVPAIVAGLARDNDLASRPAAARITVTRGPGARGLASPPPTGQRPTMLVTLAPGSAPAETAPMRLFLSSRRRYSGALAASFKALGGYLDNILAFNEACDAGYDDALLLNEAGRIASATRANIFLCKDDLIVTPPLGEGALPGVVRGALIAGAGEHGVEIVEHPIAPDDIKGALLFVSNSLIGVAPAALAAAAPPPASKALLTRLQTWYHRCLQRELSSGRTEN